MPPGAGAAARGSSGERGDLLYAAHGRSDTRRSAASLDSALSRRGATGDPAVDLESQLAEMYFTHEFFRALTRYTSVDDVCSVIVDGVSGVLGAPISAVYLLSQDDWTLRLRAFQGCAEHALATVVSIAETILGEAFRECRVAHGELPTEGSAGWWAAEDLGVVCHAAAPLLAGESVLGVVAVGFTRGAALADSEADLFASLANQASLALQNALLLAELERMSVTDRVTQLYNHGHFHQRLEEEFGRAARFDHPLSLVMLDLDDFRAFNDLHGHARGDDVLRAVSSVIRSSLRDMDVAARYGGGQFAIVLPETAGEGALVVAERIRLTAAGLRIPVEGNDGASCTVSAGIATYPEDARGAQRLMEIAELALCKAKRLGKNRVNIDRPCSAVDPS